MTTHKDQIFQWGGTPVGAPRFYGWWGEDTWFVDNDNGGSAGGKVGKTPTSAIKYLEDAIANGNKWDTIYIRPKDPAATDPGQIKPNTATNWVIPNAKHGMNIIGAGPVIGNANAGINLTHIRGHSSVTTESVLDIRAPGCSIENLHMHDGAVAIGAAHAPTAILLFSGAGMGTGYNAYGSAVSNCMFRWATPPAIANVDNWFISVDDCWFENCDYGLYNRNVTSHTHNFCARNLVFTGTAGNICCSIYNYAGSSRGVTFDQIIFNHALPTKTLTMGGDTMYFYEVEASGGSCWSRCYSIDANMEAATDYAIQSLTGLPGCIDTSGNNWGVT